MAARHAGLGKGLSALIKDTPVPATAADASATVDVGAGAVPVPVAKIHKSPWQPRRIFDDEALGELVDSIREHGVLQPLLVRADADAYQLIAGERRLRAAREAGLETVPAIVMEVSDQQAVEITLIENLQREDLNPIEEAEGYQALADQFNLTQEQIAGRVGKGRATVANAVRLLSLPEPVREALGANQLSSGHAKVLLGLEIPEEQTLLAARVVKEGLSVRALERVVAQRRRPLRKTRDSQTDIPVTHISQLTDQLHHALGTSVRLRSCKTLPSGKKLPGAIEIDYYSADDLDRLLSLLGVQEGL